MGGRESDDVLRAAQGGTEEGEATRWHGEQCGAERRLTRQRMEARPGAECRDEARRCEHSAITGRASHAEPYPLHKSQKPQVGPVT